jgi:uncharacterized protein YbjT (DUF2867 family)/membrane protease YdiL (CAAX protease family)
MIVAVIGGTGFLGKHVVTALQGAGLSVRALSRRNGFDALHPAPEALRGVDAVVNLVGIKRENGSQTFRSVHVEAMLALIAAMKSHRIRRLIHVSVVVARPDPRLPYNDTKWKGEEVVRASGLDYTILRPGVIYGEGDDMLNHLALMIKTSPIFPIVENGAAPMRPVDVRDVASAVLAALQVPCSGKTYDIVSSDRLSLREVVRRVADALSLPIRICPTPLAFMRGPVRIMEAVMKQPLSTAAQLAMLAEGLDGDPAPAREDLGIFTDPFTVARIRPLLAKTQRTAPLNLRLLSALPLPHEISGMSFSLLMAFALSSIAFALGATSDKWTGMTVAMGLAIVGVMPLPSVRRHLKPSGFQITLGMAAGVALYGMTRVVAAMLFAVRPDWQTSARALYAWKAGHSALFLGTTLIMIVFAEELLWRGVVSRFLMENCGRVMGMVCAAAIYALAHWAAFNPLLLLAAFGCGLYWGCLYAVTDNLISPAVSHLVWDVLLLFALPIVRV